MSEPTPQEDYEKRLRRFVVMVHGQEGLIAKLAIFREVVRHYRERGDGLWEISPPLYFFARAMQTDVLLALARILEEKQRSWGNLEKFLDFSAANSGRIVWKNGQFSEAVAFKHKSALATHSDIIASIRGRRDKVIAHLDRKYFFDPEAVEDDFPLADEAMIALANEIIKILHEHERGVSDSWSFHLAEFYQIGVDNMIRSLEDIARQKKRGA
ncbi:hypothetical protein GRI39_12280 [Altererythrobacter indicus]|uniref:HEPN AbiU2-like domain-containing protein n=1 Tax=Altericroceibacterium indicum TaxID=374177 RepID=A0A845ABQ0_9SPHN|nr:hypothetical protein [Altericroceibacterium indicum]